MSKVFADVGKYLFWIVIYHLILKAEHCDVLGFEVRLPFGIVGLAEQAIVVRAIQLDRNFFAWAVEVNDVRADAVLAS